MGSFSLFDSGLSYTDMLQLDGAFSLAHVSYGKAPQFNGIVGRNLATGSRRDSLSSEDYVCDALGLLRAFDGRGRGFKAKDRVALWGSYWLEYVAAFDYLTKGRPDSVVSAYVGRQAIELGLKYCMLVKTGNFTKGHDLGKLACELRQEYSAADGYMNYVVEFCDLYGKYVEGGSPEYFRYPEYAKGFFFAGNRLDISWLLYNQALVLLKLVHFAGLDDELNSMRSGS